MQRRATWGAQGNCAEQALREVEPQQQLQFTSQNLAEKVCNAVALRLCVLQWLSLFERVI